MMMLIFSTGLTYVVEGNTDERDRQAGRDKQVGRQTDRQVNRIKGERID